MTEQGERFDLTPLDPTRDSERFESAVRAIIDAASEQLAARRAGVGVFTQVAGWWKPLLAAAAITGIVALAALASLPAGGPADGSEGGIAEAIGIPEQVASWVLEEEAPDVADLLVTLEGEL
jgi:hypothetical protein